MQDVITSNRLDDLWENQQVPTLEAVQRQFTEETSAKQQELFAVAMKQWQMENTQLYFLVKDSIIISGDWETLDRETIKNRFTSGRLRDGLACIAWVNSFHDHHITRWTRHTRGPDHSSCELRCGDVNVCMS